VALVPLLYQLTRSTVRQGFILGAVTGLVASAGLVYWTSDVMVTYGGLNRWASVGALLALVGYLACFTTIFGGLTALACRLGGAQAILVSPVLWVGCEIFRKYPWGGFPWCQFGYSQVGVLPVLQLASITGIYGISLLLVLVNAAMAYGLTLPGWKRTLAASLPVAVLLGLVLSYGVRELSESLPEATFPVAAVQGRILQENKWDPAYASQIYKDHLGLSVRAAQQGARLVVWPESAIPFRFDEAPQLAEHMKRFARQHDIYLLFGSDDYETVETAEGGGYRAFNGAKMITPTGDLSLRYHKNILVPFGEYVPNKDLFFFAEALTEGVSDFSPGEEVVVANVGQGSLGVFICYEAIYGELIREFVLGGAELLVNVTNDAWFGRSSAPHQHFLMVTARAAETRRYVVRAANTGISAIVDPYGRVLKKSDLFVQDVVSGKISFRKEQTPFVRFGNLIGRASAAVTLFFALFAAFSFIRKRRR
jgi:apolipoprotein N-acyltransferase